MSKCNIVRNHVRAEILNPTIRVSIFQARRSLVSTCKGKTIGKRVNQPYSIFLCSYIDPDKEFYLRKISSNIFLPINLNMCFGCSKEPSH